tara:strand:+ start:57129 stop:57365 length:237 start_codon:yes stop_codon:yes gene_type:complete
LDQAENLGDKTQKERYSIQQIGGNKKAKLVQCVSLGPFAFLCKNKIPIPKINPPEIQIDPPFYQNNILLDAKEKASPR